MSKQVHTVSFLARFVGAFGQFFKYLGDGQYAGRCQLVAKGERLALEVPPQVVTETVEVIREVEVPTLASVSSDGALQLLQLFQQEARFIDFLQESIDDYSDADVGAAARQIHKGCAKVLAQHFTVEVVNTAPENSRVEVASDYDNSHYQLSGKVSGQGPFQGTLVHPGWQVSDIRLPKVSRTDHLHILAPAQVEV